MTDQSGVPFAVVIPSYRPLAAFLDLVRDLAASPVPAIVVVDDGSGAPYRDIFAQAAALPKVHLVHHAVNLGKGAALKSGFHFALSTFPDLVGVVTADADGQHHPEDIQRVAASLLAHPESLVLGSRTFAADVPLRSRIGNLTTRSVMHALVGRKFADTQTGLRGIPTGLVPLLLRIDASGYEFELEMLIAAHHAAVQIIEEPIRTIYQHGNASSHFSPIVDSMKIYFVLLRFTSVSLMTAALDNLIFYLVYRRTSHILGAQIVSRCVSLVFQYTMLRRSVFHSRQRHRDVLPKFVGLLLVNGSASYGAIRWAAGSLGMAAVPAKLMVETLLFFFNFVLQRSFVFRQKRAGETRAALWRLLFPLLLLLAVALEVYGFARGQLFAQTIWYPWGLHRFLRYAAIFLAAALPLLILVPWTFVALLLATGAIGTMLAAGPLALLAPVFFIVSAGALGSRLLGRTRDGLDTQLCATLCGIAIYVFLMTLTARLPVHYPLVWAILLALPIAFDWPGVRRRLAGWVRGIRCATLRSPAERASLALLAFVLGIHWLVVLRPEIGADGLSTHLAIPANIAAHHAYTVEPANIVWAVVPLATDWSYSIVYLLGGELGTRLLNFAFLLLVEALLYCAVRRWLARPATFVLLAGFASTPLALLVTGSLFVENLVTALVLGMLVALWRFGDTRERGFLYATAVLAGTALAAKFGNFAFVVAALPFIVVEARRHRKWSAVAALLFCAAAIPGYAIAWWKTGNPLFPYLNLRFPSPLLPASTDFHDVRFSEPLRWHTPFDLTFYTHRFYEGQNGSIGFQYLFLLPLAALAVLVARRRPAVCAAVVAFASAILILHSVPNARYVYAVLPLLVTAAAATLAWIAAHQPRFFRVAIAALVAWTALNVWFMPSSGWYNKDFYLSHLFSPLRAARSLAEVSPYRALVQRFRHDHPNELALLTGDDDLADLSGDGYPTNWHSTRLYDQILDTARLPQMVRLMRKSKVRYYIGQRIRSSPLHPEALRELFAFCTAAEYESHEFYVARLSPACEQGDDAAILRQMTDRPLGPSKPGSYDDFDTAIRYRGEWIHTDEFDGPYLHTVSYTDEPGAVAELAFEGQSVEYVFAKAPNRGVVQIAIDGTPRASLDLYSARVEWRSHATFSCAARGLHVVAIRVAGRKNPDATGQFVDVDALNVQ